MIRAGTTCTVNAFSRTVQSEHSFVVLTQHVLCNQCSLARSQWLVNRMNKVKRIGIQYSSEYEKDRDTVQFRVGKGYGYSTMEFRV